MNKLASILIIAALVFSMPGTILAQEQTCVTQYGGAVVCGVSTPTVTVEPVKAGLGDVDPLILGVLFIFLSLGLLKYKSSFKKAL